MNLYANSSSARSRFCHDSSEPQVKIWHPDLMDAKNLNFVKYQQILLSILTTPKQPVQEDTVHIYSIKTVKHRHFTLSCEFSTKAPNTSIRPCTWNIYICIQIIYYNTIVFMIIFYLYELIINYNLHITFSVQLADYCTEITCNRSHSNKKKEPMQNKKSNTNANVLFFFF